VYSLVVETGAVDATDIAFISLIILAVVGLSLLLAWRGSRIPFDALLNGPVVLVVRKVKIILDVEFKLMLN